MKKLLASLLLAGVAGLSTGCSTPGYTGGWPSIRFPDRTMTGENSNHYVRNAAYEFDQMTDDFNSLLLLDPPSRLTRWNVR
jgi:hypothetical protein